MNDDQSPRLLLLDGHSLAYRAFYAVPVENFSTSTGQPTNAVHGFTAMLINALRDENPSHVAVAFDVSRQTFRTEQYPEYKATRAASPEAFRGQVDLIKEVLAAMRIVAVQAAGFEADDVIATLATQAKREGFQVSIITGDRDAFALVDGDITVLFPVRGVSELARMTPDAVFAKYGLTPGQYPDYAALRGDPSDNLPGIPGVGEKTAVKWIRDFGTLADLVSRVDEVPGKAGDSLRAALAQVLTNRRLTELVRDVDLPVAPGDLGRVDIDVAAVETVLASLQFRALRERLFTVLGPTLRPQVAVASPEQVIPEPEVDVLTTATLGAWLDKYAGIGSAVAVDVAGSWGRGIGQVRALALAAEGRTASVVPAELTDDTALAAWLADPMRPKWWHDAKGPLLALWSSGLDVAGIDFDTAVAAYLVAPGQRSFDLNDVCLAFLGHSLPDSDSADQLSLDLDASHSTDHAARAVAVRELVLALRKETEARGARDLFNNVELPLVRLLAELERVGIAVDQGVLQRLEADFAEQSAAAEHQAHEIVGRPFNLGSPKQLQEILFVERGLPKTKKIKTGYTTDADALQWLASASDDALLPVLLHWRDVIRLKQTVASLIPLVAADGRIHTTFNQLVAATGRLSSTDPNLQNIPVRTEAGRRIRAAFTVGAGFSELLTADYSQIELRIMAHLSHDSGLIEAFRSGEDLHTTMAAGVFGVDHQQVDAEMRRRIKAMSYGLAYGLSAFGLSQQLGIAASEAKLLIENYLERFGGVRAYLNEVVAAARISGYTETLLGRRRYLPDLTSENHQRREMAERMALNAPIQGSAADLIKVAMLHVDQDLKASELKSRLLLQVHDELVIEVGPGERDQVAEIVTRRMSGAYPLLVPLDISIGTGSTWDEAAH
ncbi:MAG: DNA polymerase I [Actinomycetes bacterium]